NGTWRQRWRPHVDSRKISLRTVSSRPTSRRTIERLLAFNPLHKTWRHIVGDDKHAQHTIVGIHPTNNRARGIDRRVLFPPGWQARRRSLTHDGAQSEVRARAGRLRVHSFNSFNDQLAIWRGHRQSWRHGDLFTVLSCLATRVPVRAWPRRRSAVSRT